MVRRPSHQGLPAADVLLERVFDVFAAQPSEHARTEIARAALAAATYRAEALKQPKRRRDIAHRDAQEE
jgi:hypothetical protein